MGDLRSRLGLLLEERRQRLAEMRVRAVDHQRDAKVRGAFRDMLALTLRFVGVAEYVEHCSIRLFRADLDESSGIDLLLCNDFEGGGSVDCSLVSPLVYKAIFNALAAGSFDTAEALAAWTPNCPTKGMAWVHPFDEAMCRALAAVVLGDATGASARIRRLAERCKGPLAGCAGYCDAFDGLACSDAQLVERGLRRVVADHPQLTRRGRIFHGTEDELLSIWGIGVANLARRRGMRVGGFGPLIPDELLVD